MTFVNGLTDVNESPEQIDGAEGKVSGQQLDLLLHQLQRLPTPHAVAARLVELASGADETSAPDELVRLISCDQALTARLLYLTGDASPERPRTAQGAARLLKPQVVRSEVLSVNIGEVRSLEEAPRADLVEFWRHCLAVGIATEMLAEVLQLPLDPKESFTCGLLHDLGKLALWTLLPKSYARVLEAAEDLNGSITDHERNIIGVDHCVAGRRLAEYWGLHQVIQEVAWLHHHPLEGIPDSLADRKLIAVVSLADAAARELRLGFSGNYAPPETTEAIRTDLALPPDQFDKIAQALPSRLEKLIESLSLPKADTEVLYREVLTTANTELSRINEQLAHRVEQADVQVSAFRHLRDFASGLSGDSTVDDALVSIAEVLAAAGLTGNPDQPIIVYSIDQQTAEVLVLRYSRGGSPEWRSLRCNPRYDRGLPDESTSPADALGIFSDRGEELSEWIDTAAYRYRPLCCADQLIGGALYPNQDLPGTEGESQEIIDALSGPLGMALGIIQGRCKAVALCEQLTTASRALTEGQKQLVESRALAEVAEMAAGAGHEINTPLAVVSGRAQVMAEKASSEEERSVWRLISLQAQAISDTISDLMEFAHPPAPHPESCNVRELLESAVNLFSRSDHPQAKSSRVDIRIEEGVPLVLVDREQMARAMAELIANAATAAPEAPIYLGSKSDVNGAAVLVSVADSGPGMDRSTLSKAFTPFFSLQKAGRRRGLGLPRVKRFVENGGGQIWIDTRPGAGTRVCIRLPLARKGEQNK